MDSDTLRSAIKSARDQMRKDENLSTDVDRIPQFSWILFLKCFDDLEVKQGMLDPAYQPVIPQGYRWKDWASETDRGEYAKSLTGSDLIQFVNENLFPKLAQLTGDQDKDQRDVIASIFKEISNRFVSGFVLRKVLNIVDKINFRSADDIHTIAHMYEQLLVEMRDAAGTNGEFYTPRPVIRFIIKQIDPSLARSEKILDPACGTGGFLIESLAHMNEQIGTIADQKKLCTKTLYGIEKKPMPYLLGLMNLLLHEVDDPNMVRINTLAKPLLHISNNDRYDIVVTNPPFGGEEEEGISRNLPAGMQTSNTELAFLVYIMAVLKENGRCAIILPDGPLFATGTASRIKKKLLADFNLHTIVRLPRSVFEPYTSVATNILFFERSGTTKEIWYYSMKVSDRVKGRGRESRYSKTKPIEYGDFAEVEKWFKKKTKNENAWKVRISQIENFNLDSRNPNDVDTTTIPTPHELVRSYIVTRQKIVRVFQDIEKIISKEIPK